jgi:hypothetical protein
MNNTDNRKKNPAAVALGKLGGSAKASKPKGFAAISPARRRAISKKGVLAKARNKKEQA